MNHDRTWKTIAALSIFIPVLICIFALPRLTGRPGNVKIAVLFDGHTNDSRGTLLTRWRFTNEGEVTVRLDRDYHLETKQKSKFFPDTRFFSPGLDFFRHGGGLLRPHKSEVFTIPSVTGHGEWRAGFRFVPYGWKTQVLDRIGVVRTNTPLWKFRLIY